MVHRTDMVTLPVDAEEEAILDAIRGIELVINVAHQLLQKVLQGNQAACAAVLVQRRETESPGICKRMPLPFGRRAFETGGKRPFFWYR